MAECSESYSFANRNPQPKGSEPKSCGDEVKTASICSQSHNLDAHKVCGDCGADMRCDEDDVEDNAVANAHVNEETCTVCGIQFSLEDYPNYVPVFVPRCLHIICSTCCKNKAVPNRKCPVNGCGMDCPDKVSAFPMHVVMVKRLRDQYMKRKSASLSENAEDMKAHYVAIPCTADCNTNQQQQLQQDAASCKEGEATGPIKHEAKWFCSICDENFCDEYYQNVHQRFKVTKGHPAVSLEDIDPVDRHEASLTKCSDPRHRGADVSMYDSSSGAFHCRLCDVSPQAESAKETMQKDYAAIADMLQSSEGVYAKCTNLHRNIGARIVYESNVLKSECDQVNAWYSASIDKLTKERDKHLAELRNVSKQTQSRLKTERSKLTPLVQCVEATAVDIGVRPHRHIGKVLSRRTDYFDAPVVRKAKELLDTLNDLLTQMCVPGQDCYTSACAKGPVIRNTIGSTVAADALFPVSEESPHFITSLNTAVDIALNNVQSSSPSMPSSASSTPHTNLLSPVAAFHLLHRTAKDAKRPFSVPLVWFALGHCYHRGIGTASSLQDAVNWYSKAAEVGMLWAMEMIAECHADDHWATSEKDKCKSVYADAIHRAGLYRSIAECKKSSEAPTAAALLVRTWALYPFTRDIGSLRADSPSMREYKSTLPTLLCTHFLPRVMPVDIGVTHQKDPLALFTLLNVDFRSVVPREEWYDILSQVGNTLSLAPAHHLIAKELVVGSRYYTQRDDDSDDAMSVSSSSATVTAAASTTVTCASSPIISVTTSSDEVSKQTHLPWSEKLWKSVEWIHDIAVHRGNTDTLAHPLAALALAELSCDYLEGCFSLARLPSQSNAKKSKAFDWFKGFDADKSRRSQVRMLLSRWLHPVIMDGYESARVLSARLVLTKGYLVARSNDNNGVSSRDYARVVVESTCPKGSSSAFALCRILLWNAITKQTYVSNPSSLVECGVIPQQTTMNTTTFGTFSSSSSFGPPTTTTEAFLVAMLRPYAGRTATLRLTLPFMALPSHLTTLEVAADKGNVDARVIIADCHSLLLYIRKHEAVSISTRVTPSFGGNHGSNSSGSLSAPEASLRQKTFAPRFDMPSSVSNGRMPQLDGVNLSTSAFSNRPHDNAGERNDEGAFEFNKTAADSGNVAQMRKLPDSHPYDKCSYERESADEDPTSLERYVKAAEAGDARAMFHLAVCYENGDGIAKDESKAFEWYKKAAEAGDARAMATAARCYMMGTGVVKDESKAFEWYQKAGDGGLAQAMLSVGLCYSNGVGVVQDDSKAFEWFKKAADGGNVTAMFNVGVSFGKGTGIAKDGSKAFEWYRKAAYAGLAQAMLIVGLYYEKGTGVGKDESKAFEWYMKAVDGGLVDAMLNLAVCYTNGIGVVKDASKAFEWYNKGADGGDVKAMYIVGVCYDSGTGVAKDESKAFEWYKKAAEGGHVEAMLNAAVCCNKGKGVAKDESKAFEWYQKAADEGDVTAMFYVGECYKNGTGVGKDESKAFEWYKKAADGGLIQAMFKLGLCYSNGDGVVQDDSKAFEWFKKAAVGGDVTATFNVAVCYEKGTGVGKDESKAIEWYLKAADGGDVKAMSILGVCYKDGTGVAKDESKSFEWLNKAADGGLVEAMFLLAVCYANGIGVVKDESKAFEWYKKAGDGDLVQAMLSVGLCYDKGTGVVKDEWKAFEWYKKGADSGDVKAMLCLAACYMQGDGVLKNESMAFEWSKKAGDGGLIQAMRNVGLCYKNGVGVVQDDSKAFEWFKKAAFGGDVTAAFNVAVCYEKGTGVGKDESKAFEWYKMAAEGGDVDAMFNVGLRYENGNGVSKDESKAVEWYQKAADGGLVRAMLDLAMRYSKGTGVSKDESKAFEWYRKAAVGGSVAAMYYVGECYMNGDGVDRDGSKAFGWYKKAADAGLVPAMFQVGLCYDKGIGVFIDEWKAFDWYKKAADGGEVTAMFNLAACYANGEGVLKNESKAFEWYLKAGDGGMVQALYVVGVYYEHGIGVPRNEFMAVEWYKKAAWDGHKGAAAALHRLRPGVYRV